MRNIKSSSGNGHPYMKGFRFWDQNRFWETDMYSQASKDYYNNWLDGLRMNERQLTRLGAGR